MLLLPVAVVAAGAGPSPGADAASISPAQGLHALPAGTLPAPGILLRRVGQRAPHACTPAGSSRGPWPSTGDRAWALTAGPWNSWVDTPPNAVALAGPGQVQVGSAAPHVDPCEDAFFDRWSQRWFTRSATRIADVPFCPRPGRPVV